MGMQKALIGFIWIKFMNWDIAASIMKTSNNIVFVNLLYVICIQKYGKYPVNVL